MTRIFTLIALLALLNACALIDMKSPGHSYGRSGDFGITEDKPQGETRLQSRSSESEVLSDQERYQLEKKFQLEKLEGSLISEAEREQYFNYKPYLPTIDDRIDFLSLSNVQARDQYAMRKGIYFSSNRFMPTVRDAIKRSDIILGMPKGAVIESWGEPVAVEVAGNQNQENERWSYVDYISTQEGYLKEERIVIFEGGKVVGWFRN